MPIQVTDIDSLQQYIKGVLDRADHHASNVNEIVLAIAGAIIWRKDSDPIKVRTQAGDMKNILWVKISGKQYVFAYSHKTGAIQIREGTTRGSVVCSLTNSTSLTSLRQTFLLL